MKLLRYGPNGHEMRGILDDNGHIHDLSGEVRDISEEVLLPFSLNRLKRLDMNSLPLVAGDRASERASDESENSSASDPQVRK
jgi:hypothetical protein